jgi:hypothetical protein
MWGCDVCLDLLSGLVSSMPYVTQHHQSVTIFKLILIVLTNYDKHSCIFAVETFFVSYKCSWFLHFMLLVSFHISNRQKESKQDIKHWYMDQTLAWNTSMRQHLSFCAIKNRKMGKYLAHNSCTSLWLETPVELTLTSTCWTRHKWCGYCINPWQQMHVVNFVVGVVFWLLLKVVWHVSVKHRNTIRSSTRPSPKY